ncbi:EamA family transporter [Streptomyces sp. 3MP-14]|uniref:EamA family transporter n=1 Tax=Streptomyces mimosae TaxID=2586635 RepID=A0A5N5ZNB8_9ACTN|nr:MULTISPECIES: DMT family transporter [Streptomyces]KAB8157439.1 EamA family transporter [Streptomyces mimosae]KAB8172263.1 EamA family transporter [Streptomyces sp. 3MP-14]
MTVRNNRSWIVYAGLLVLFWGVWGATSSQPVERYGYPDEMIYIIWAFTMLVPAAVALRRQRFDRRPVAAVYGLLAGLTGAGGQLVLFQALADGPAYLIFPIVSLSPVITVLMAVVLLRERIVPLAVVGVFTALVAILLLSIPSGDGGDVDTGSWLVLAVLICAAWGAQAFFMRKAALAGVNDATTFGWMTITGLALVPVAYLMMGGMPSAPWQAPAITAGTQVLNAVGALFLVMALSRGKASVVAPITNALAPVLTVVLSLAIYQTVPSVWSSIGIVLALAGSTLMVYTDEKRDEDVVAPGAADPVVR